MTTDVLMTQTLNLWDLSLDDQGDLTNGDFFDSSLLYSIYGERRATAAEVPDSRRRRGWIGNENADFENGSKIWLFEQARNTRSNLNLLESTAFNSLKWFIEDGLLFNVQVTALATRQGTTLQIDLFRFNSEVDRRFFALWDNTGQ